MILTHYPVLYREVVTYLKPQEGQTIYFDGTLGEGGHAYNMLEHYPALHLVGTDADEVMLERAKGRLRPFSNRATFLLGWNDTILENYSLELGRPDLMLFDLGISIYHYEKTGRGFSFLKDERLDMRLDQNQTLDAYAIVNGYSQAALQKIFSSYGEEPFSGRIARAIVEARKLAPIFSAYSLAQLVKEAVPKLHEHKRIHPATRVFQALRIEVNGELKRLERLLEVAYSRLNVGGKMGVITFHSLEDRIVKNFFRVKHSLNRESTNKYSLSRKEPVAELLFKKAITASEVELGENPPSRSAKFRAICKLKE